MKPAAIVLYCRSAGPRPAFPGGPRVINALHTDWKSDVHFSKMSPKGWSAARRRLRHRALKSPQTSLTIMNSKPENRHMIAVTMVNELV